MADESSNLIAAIERHEALAESFGALSEDRTKALDFYLGNPLGNEVEGRSQVISRDVFDTVEWIKPQLSEIFCSGDEILKFTARGPEDEQAAEQESDYVNHIVTERNRWFEIWTAWSHDALLQKTGYVKAFWDDAEDRTRERYSGLTEQEYQALLVQDDVQEVEHEVLADAQTGMVTHSCVVERVKPQDVVRIVNVAPEHIFVDANARTLSLQDQSIAFVEQREYKTISQLRNEGFDVPDDIADGGEGAADWEEALRDENNPFRNREGEEADPSMRRVKVRECWIRHDDDGDGRAELLHVIVVGTTVLLKEDADCCPIVALCPRLMPHQHYGLSMADAVMELQRIKTALLRGTLDNVYLANNGRYAIDQDNVNLDDMLESRPGGVVRVSGDPTGKIVPLTHGSTGEIGVAMMEYIDRIKESRTGVSQQAQGLDPNSLQKITATQSSILNTAQQQMIKFVARVFAETGVRALFQVVHALTLKHSRQTELVKLRNAWVPVDPRMWVKRSDMTLSVALGAGDKPMQMAFLLQTLQQQMGLAPVGLASPPKVFNTLKRLAQLHGYKNPEEFWDNPATQPPKPQGPPPEVQAQMAKIQGQMQIEQAKLQGQMQAEQMRSQVQLQSTRAQLELQAANDARDAERERQKAETQAQLEAMKLQFEKYKADLDASVRLQIAGIQQATQSAQAQGEARTEGEAGGEEVTQEQPEVDSAAQMQAVMESMAMLSQMNQQLLQTQAGMQQQMAQLAELMRRPRKVIRGADGRISGVSVE